MKHDELLRCVAAVGRNLERVRVTRSTLSGGPSVAADELTQRTGDEPINERVRTRSEASCTPGPNRWVRKRMTDDLWSSPNLVCALEIARSGIRKAHSWHHIQICQVGGHLLPSAGCMQQVWCISPPNSPVFFLF